MDLIKRCKWCKDKRGYKINALKCNVWQLDFCSKECNEEYFTKYRCGCVPASMRNLPIVDYSEKFLKEQIEITNYGC